MNILQKIGLFCFAVFVVLFLVSLESKNIATLGSAEFFAFVGMALIYIANRKKKVIKL